MKIKNLLLLTLLFASSCLVYSQKHKSKTDKKTKSSLAGKFDDADYDYSIEDYYSAIGKYKTILETDSLNANVNYCVGLCYMKTKFDRKKAIPYLKKAIGNVSNKYENGTFDEKNANIDAYFLLGQAYRLNNELDKAINAFTEYKKLLAPKDFKNNSIVENEMESCKNAKKEVKSFASISQRPVPKINTKYSDYNAVTSTDDNIIIFACQQLEGKASEEKKILFSRKVNGKWTTAIDITEGLKTKDNMVPTYLSPNGKYLLLALNEDGNTAIFESRFVVTKKDSGSWTPVKKLNKNINTGKVTHAALSPDASTIYFTSDRKGGFGGLDIYKAEKDKHNDWGTAVNLGSKINTSFDEETPFFTSGNVLYFSSAGHSSIGGLDMFYSKLDSKGEWAISSSMGFLLNTTDDDYFYFPLGDGAKGYISQTGDDALGEKDIYKIEIIEGSQNEEFKGGIKKEEEPKK